MYPSLSELFEDLFNIHVRIPIQTLGFFIGLAFIAAYYVFTLELKRYEALGLIHSFKRKVLIGKPIHITELVINAVLGFTLGFKVFGAILDYTNFINNPKGFILSARGNLLAGLLFCAGWAYWAYRDRKKEQLTEPIVVEETVHPYQLMMKITFWAGFWGFIGARLFDCLEHINIFIHDPVNQFLFYGGYTYYGGFLFGMITYFYIGVKHGMKLGRLADIGAPGITIAYAIGRIGCNLSGDGDWGIVNLHPKPHWLQWLPNWMWSFRFPHNVINAGTYINGCRGNYCNQLPAGVYPTSFYEFVMVMLIFLFIWLIRKRVRLTCFITFIAAFLCGAERFLIEGIRVNVRYHLPGLSFTQAQLLSLTEMLIGIGGLIYIYTRKEVIAKKYNKFILKP